VSLKSVLQALEPDPELLIHAAIIFASVSSCLNAMQFTGGAPPTHCSAVGIKLAGAPLEELTRLVVARLTALSNPVVLLDGAPMLPPVASANPVSTHSAATVVNSLTTTKVELLRAPHCPVSTIRPIAELEPLPGSPPAAMIKVWVVALGQVYEVLKTK